MDNAQSVSCQRDATREGSPIRQNRQPVVLGINGSPFEGGHTAQMLQEALDAAYHTGARVATLNVPADIPHCDGRREED